MDTIEGPLAQTHSRNMKVTNYTVILGRTDKTTYREIIIKIDPSTSITGIVKVIMDFERVERDQLGICLSLSMTIIGTSSYLPQLRCSKIFITFFKQKPRVGFICQRTMTE